MAMVKRMKMIKKRFTMFLSELFIVRCLSRLVMAAATCPYINIILDLDSLLPVIHIHINNHPPQSTNVVSHAKLTHSKKNLPEAPSPTLPKVGHWSLICPDKMWIVSGPRNVRGRWRYSGDDDDDDDGEARLIETKRGGCTTMSMGWSNTNSSRTIFGDDGVVMVMVVVSAIIGVDSEKTWIEIVVRFEAEAQRHWLCSYVYEVPLE